MFRPGDRIGPYQVVEHLGSGGMGEVYAAEDVRLGRMVAVKVLSPERNEDSTSRERFLREARLASSLDDHPHICAIYDVEVTPEGRPYIVMAKASGETLRTRLKNGPLPPEEAREIAIQVARGLAEAHEKKIIHRDIKPENLTVARSDNGTLKVKILDFGIAKGDGAALTMTGRHVGTISYMSPEQVAGSDADVRADVWALGAVLYEMLTGSPAFKGDRDLKVLHSVMNADPQPIRSLVPPVPRDLCEIVDRCLEKDPKKRYASGAEVLEDLERGRARAKNGFTTVRPGIRISVVALLSVVLLGIGFLSAAPGRELLRKLMGRFLGETSYYVAVLPFSATDEEDMPLASGLTEFFTTTIASLGAGTDSLWVVPFEAMLASGANSPEEVRKLYPVDRVLRGEVNRGTSEMEVVVELMATDEPEPRTLLSATLPGPSDKSFQGLAQGLLARSLRLRGEGRPLQTSEPLPAASPGNRFYLRGAGYLHDMYSEGSVTHAISLFEQAIAADSFFAPAYAGLCQAHWELFRRNGDPNTARRAESMCNQAVSLSRNEPLALAALGRTQLQTGQPQAALETLKRARELSPRSAEVYRWLGRVHESQGEMEKAEEAYKRAVALRPDVWLYYSDLGIMYANFERHQEAIEQHREVILLSPENPHGYIDLGAAHMSSNHLDEAEDLFLQSIQLQPTALAYRNLGYLYLREQAFEKAAGALRSSIALDDEVWWTWRWLAHVEHWRGREEEAREAWQRVITLTEPRLEVNRKDRDLLCGLAEAHVALGNEQEGRRYLDRLTVLSPTLTYNLYWAGRIYEMLGSRDAALEYIHQALRDGLDSLTVQRDPWLSDLLRDPRFQQYSAGG